MFYRSKGRRKTINKIFVIIAAALMGAVLGSMGIHPIIVGLLIASTIIMVMGIVYASVERKLDDIKFAIDRITERLPK